MQKTVSPTEKKNQKQFFRNLQLPLLTTLSKSMNENGTLSPFHKLKRKKKSVNPLKTSTYLGLFPKLAYFPQAPHRKPPYFLQLVAMKLLYKYLSCSLQTFVILKQFSNGNSCRTEGVSELAFLHPLFSLLSSLHQEMRVLAMLCLLRLFTFLLL